MKNSLFITLVFLMIPVILFAVESDNITITSKEIVVKLAKLESKFETIDQKFETMDQKLETMNQKFSQKFETINQKFEAMDQKFEAMDQKFEAMDQKFSQKFEAMDQKFSQKIEAMDQKFSQKIDSLNQNINIKLEVLYKNLSQAIEASNQKSILKFVGVEQTFKAYHQRLDDLINSVNQRFADLHNRITIQYHTILWVIGFIGAVLAYLVKKNYDFQKKIDALPLKILSMIQDGNIVKTPEKIKEQTEEKSNKEDQEKVIISLAETVEVMKDNLSRVMEHLKKVSNFDVYAPQPI